jgi:broad-specificity NMP kinase
MAKPPIVFITGTSGSGKTTLVSIFKALPSTWACDIDEEGVPEGADEKWRQKKTNELLVRAKANQAKGNTTILCGVFVPKEVKDSPAYERGLNIKYGYIHIDEDTIRSRLGKRGWEEDHIDANVNWAKHLEKYVKAEKGKIVNATNKTAKKIAKEFLDWIKGS